MQDNYICLRWKGPRPTVPSNIHIVTGTIIVLMTQRKSTYSTLNRAV